MPGHPRPGQALTQPASGSGLQKGQYRRDSLLQGRAQYPQKQSRPVRVEPRCARIAPPACQYPG